MQAGSFGEKAKMGKMGDFSALTEIFEREKDCVRV